VCVCVCACVCVRVFVCVCVRVVLHTGNSQMNAWPARFAGATLAAAIAAWQARHSLERGLTTGFLTGSQPLVDGYELAVRLEHMLRRLSALQGAATAEAPAQVRWLAHG
jgi:hypothetical protein